MILEADLRGATKVDPSFLSVVLELDDDLFRGVAQMRERVAEHYGIPVSQVQLPEDRASPEGGSDG